MMNGVDTSPLRQLLDHLDITAHYVLPSLAAWQIQEHQGQEELPQSIGASIDRLRNVALMSRDYLQIGVFEFLVGVDMLQGGRTDEAIRHFDAARRQWLFIDHLPLISLAHFGQGMAFQVANKHQKAAAAYFKVKECLQQAEVEPHRLERIEAERSLQSFWNDLERWLLLAISSLRRDFDSKQKKRLERDLLGASAVTESVDHLDADPEELAPGLMLHLRWPPVVTASDIQEILCQAIEAIDALNEALSQRDDSGRQEPLEVTAIDYSDRTTLTIELSNISDHTNAFCRWLLSTERVPAAAFENLQSPSPAERAEKADGAREEGDMSFGQWFERQAQSGRLAGMIDSYVKAARGREPEELEIERLVQAVKHLAKLRLNCQLTVVKRTR